jgi:hypothetical protein
MDTLIRPRFGDTPIDPFAGVPLEHIGEAKRTVELWSDASRSDLRQLARIVTAKKDSLPAWKKTVIAKILAKRSLETTGRHRAAVIVALDAVDPSSSVRASL